MDILQEKINYQFKNIDILRDALTHPSKKTSNSKNYQRLEFLGDSVLQLVVSDYLLEKLPKANEGQLSKTRASLVEKSALAQRAQKLNLGKYIFFGNSELNTGGKHKIPILADVYEAIIGAIYKDGGPIQGMKSAKKFILEDIEKSLNEACQKNITEIVFNPKGELQEILQAIDGSQVKYKINHEKGLPHDKIFSISAHWKDIKIGSGNGKSKKIAETNSAIDALNKKIWLSKK